MKIEGAIFMLLLSFTNEKSDLIMTIESLRYKMIQTAIKEGFGSKNTITISQQLDDYIAQFQESGSLSLNKII